MRQVAEFINVFDFKKEINYCRDRCTQVINIAKICHAKELLKSASCEEGIPLPRVGFDTSKFIANHSQYLTYAERVYWNLGNIKKYINDIDICLLGNYINIAEHKDIEWMNGFDDLIDQISLVAFIQYCIYEKRRLDDERVFFYKPFKGFGIPPYKSRLMYEELEKPGRLEIAADILPEARKHFSKITQGQLSIAVATGDLEVI